jgi:O-antigen ligase
MSSFSLTLYLSGKARLEERSRNVRAIVWDACWRLASNRPILVLGYCAFYFVVIPLQARQQWKLGDASVAVVSIGIKVFRFPVNAIRRRDE